MSETSYKCSHRTSILLFDLYESICLAMKSLSYSIFRPYYYILLNNLSQGIPFFDKKNNFVKKFWVYFQISTRGGQKVAKKVINIENLPPKQLN